MYFHQQLNYLDDQVGILNIGIITYILSSFRCERVFQSPPYEGVIHEFCREKGHGFIKPKDNPDELIFVHVSE